MSEQPTSTAEAELWTCSYQYGVGTWSAPIPAQSWDDALTTGTDMLSKGMAQRLKVRKLAARRLREPNRQARL